MTPPRRLQSPSSTSRWSVRGGPRSPRTHRHWRYRRRSTLLPGTHLSVTRSRRPPSQPNEPKPSGGSSGAVTGEASAAVPNSGGRAPTAGRLKTRPPPPALQSRTVRGAAWRKQPGRWARPSGEWSRSPHPLSPLYSRQWFSYLERSLCFLFAFFFSINSIRCGLGAPWSRGDSLVVFDAFRAP
jgi:hypothetical protein